MRIVFFGSGGLFSRAVLDVLAQRQALLAVVAPHASGRGWKRAAGDALIRAVGRDFRKLVRRHGLPLIAYRSDAVPEAVARLEPLCVDLFCIGSFPYILGKPILGLPRLGTVNLHPSLLPKHQGGDPVFWTIVGDDSETGVTLHWVDEGVDTGDVIAQRRIRVERGVAGSALVERLAREAAELFVSCLGAIENGSAPRIPQEDSVATYESTRSRAGWAIDYAAWSAERVWHVLRGIGTGQLRDAFGRAVAAGDVRTFEITPHAKRAGSVRVTSSGIRIYCRDGWVDLAPPSLKRRVGRALASRRRGASR